MYPRGDPGYVRVGVPDKLMPSFEKKLSKLDPEWKGAVYYLKSLAVIMEGGKSYRYTVYSVPTQLEQGLSLLFRIRRWLWKVARDTEFL